MLSSLCLGNTSSPLLFFLHGALGSAQDFIPIMKKLQEKFYCVSIDLPGHGDSPLIEPLSFKTTLHLIKNTIQSYTLAPAAIIGYSMGGRLALLLEAQYPDFVEKLGILSAHPGAFSDDLPHLKRQEQKWISLLREDLSLFLFHWYQQPLFNTVNKENMTQKRLKIKPHSVASVMEALALSKQPSLWNHLSETKTPIMWLYGEYDLKYKSLYALLPPHFLRLSIPESSHAIHIENIIKCSYHINDFFKLNF